MKLPLAASSSSSILPSLQLHSSEEWTELADWGAYGPFDIHGSLSRNEEKSGRYPRARRSRGPSSATPLRTYGGVPVETWKYSTGTLGVESFSQGSKQSCRCHHLLEVSERHSLKKLHRPVKTRVDGAFSCHDMVVARVDKCQVLLYVELDVQIV
jgi:hypothetical protein